MCEGSGVATPGAARTHAQATTSVWVQAFVSRSRVPPAKVQSGHVAQM